MAFLPITREECLQQGWDAPDFVFVVGEAYVDHPSFGPQFKAAAMETSVPTETQGIFEYLAAGVIKGVGKQTAGAA